MSRKLTNIQWRITRFTLGVSLLAALPALTLLVVYVKLDVMKVLTEQWFDIPVILIVLAMIVLPGIVSGFAFGNGLKQRLEELVEATLRYEKGQFAHRVPALGDDEIGLAGDRLNEMAQRVEKQVASLQRLSTEKAEMQDQLKKSVILEERQRLARELHDAVSQQLFAISMMSSAVQENLTYTEENKIHQQITMIEKMAGHAQKEMRALLLHLRPATLEGKGLREGLEELLQEFQAKQPIDIRAEITEIPPLSKGVEDHLFRIVQEGLSNVLRHSQATSVTVRVGAIDSQVFLRMIDNGVGFEMNAQKTSSYGMQMMQERAHEIGGVLDLISAPGKGTQLSLKVPIIEKVPALEPEGEQER
ncbi:NarL family two-component system sensor histidine kinase LiaS [Tumebacillus sp. BK434]|uniref:HAMP domain-containing sensor histidine kinase n=1 Tax=Tumebacillus sp. BK434 TaxID=2512169 RepID=UPI0010470838|nr:sensor histidine kinase [Tumebacillus sp. BK434]TCP58008.1 NarL family two-component system sensor histidine kinase LiaS [Tumebacillus sp. BK434]